MHTNGASPPRKLVRADELYAAELDSIHRKTDHLFVVLMMLQWVGGIALALIVSPRTWAGATSSPHIHVWLAVLLGGAIASLPIALAFLKPGAVVTRNVIAVGQMMMSSLLIHLSGGRIETHFHVFGSLAFMAFYRDWRVLAWGSAVVAIDHFLRGIFWPQSVYGIIVREPWRWLEHTFWVVFEDVFLLIACRQSLHQIYQAAERQAMVEALNVRLRNAMTETHHRVKNNLQLITAMVDLQVMEESETVSMDELKRLGNHVRALAVVHDILTDQAKVDGQANAICAKAILDRLLEAMQTASGHMKLTYEIEGFEVSSRRGTSLALVTNELVNNALKHGRSSVDVSLSTRGGHAILEVSDDGCGFPPDFDPSRQANTGLELVEQLVSSDLEARTRYDIGPNGGGRVRVTIPIATRYRDAVPSSARQPAYS